MGRLICLAIGIILVIAGLLIPSTIAFWVGIVFCALGGLWIFVLDGDFGLD